MVNVAVRLERRKLLHAYKQDGDLAAREQLIVDLMPLVRSLALRYTGRGESLEDLVQVGCIGLINASTASTPSAASSSRPTPSRRSSARSSATSATRPGRVHVPRSVKELRVRLAKILDHLSAELGRSPTIEELAKAAGAEEEDVIEALESAQAYTARSLSAPVDDERAGACSTSSASTRAATRRSRRARSSRPGSTRSTRASGESSSCASSTG